MGCMSAFSALAAAPLALLTGISFAFHIPV